MLKVSRISRKVRLVRRGGAIQKVRRYARRSATTFFIAVDTVLDYTTTTAFFERCRTMISKVGRQRRRSGSLAIVVDMCRVSFMDSTGLVALLQLHQLAQTTGLGFRIRFLKPRVRRLFQIMSPHPPVANLIQAVMGW